MDATRQQKATSWSEQTFRELFHKCADVKIEKHTFGAESAHVAILVYAEGLADTKQLNLIVMPRLKQMIGEPEAGFEISTMLDLKHIEMQTDVVSRVFSGELVLFIEHLHLLYSLNITDLPHRSPEESNTEISIKGPKDGFVEEIGTNVALIRKRLRTTSLCCESYTIGRRTNSRVALLYIDDVINPQLLEEARKRLKQIDIDALLSSSQLEKLIADQPFSLFPLLDYTARPDYAVDCLIHGRFVVLVDGAPTAVIAPANITLLLKSPEDAYFPYYFAGFGILLRIAGLTISVLLPGFWAALASFNLEQIPYPLLATIGLSRIGIPIPGPLEAFLMIGLFELFREAGERLPKAVGQTVAVVGGIVVGDAAIRAGLVSTTLLVIAAVTAVASFTLVNQSLVGSVTLVRLFVLTCSSILGMYGFILSIIAIVLYLSRLESFGMPYLAPFSPLTFKDVLGAIIRIPWVLATRRPQILHTVDSTRKKGKS